MGDKNELHICAVPPCDLKIILERRIKLYTRYFIAQLLEKYKQK